MAGTIEPTVREVVSFCRLCPALCGIRVRLDGDRILDVRGDPDHPLSQGYTCSKGRATPDFHHDPARLDQPIVRGQATRWDATLDDLASSIRAIVDEYGPDAVGFYSGMGEAYDRAGIMAKVRLFAALDSKQRYTAATVDTAPAWRASELVMGYTNDLLPIWEPDNSPAVALVIGANVVVSHGAGSDPITNIRRFRAVGGQLFVIDPRRTETAALADHHLAGRPGTDVLVLAWLVRELLDAGADADELEHHTSPKDVAALRAALQPFNREIVAARTGIAADSLEVLLAAIRASGRVACVSGTGVRFSPHALETEWLVLALQIVTGSFDRPGGVRFASGFIAERHARDQWKPLPPEGAWAPGPPTRPDLASWFNEYPVVAMPDEIEGGRLRALLVLGANPLAAWPDPDRTERALRSLDVFAVFDVMHHELTDIATHALPVADFLERPDISARDSNFFAPAVVPMGADRRPQWWILGQVARRLGLDVLDGLDPDTCTTEDVLARANGASPEHMAALVAAGPHGIPFERPTGWVRGALPEGRWRLAPPQLIERLPDVLKPDDDAPFLLTSRRRMRSVNCVRYVKPADQEREPPDVLLHPDDACALGVATGSRVRLRNDCGELVGAARVDVGIRPGCVSVTHGALDANVNHLASPFEGVDPLTGQPLMSAIRVDVELVDDAPEPGASVDGSGRRPHQRSGFGGGTAGSV